MKTNIFITCLCIIYLTCISAVGTETVVPVQNHNTDYSGELNRISLISAWTQPLYQNSHIIAHTTFILFDSFLLIFFCCTLFVFLTMFSINLLPSLPLYLAFSKCPRSAVGRLSRALVPTQAAVWCIYRGRWWGRRVGERDSVRRCETVGW